MPSTSFRLTARHRAWWRPPPVHAVLAALVVTACGGGGGGGTDTATGPTQRASALSSFDGAQACTELEQYVEDQAVATMRSQMQAARDGLPGWGGWTPLILRTLEGNVVFTAADGSAPPVASSTPTEYTTTNLRTAGVDEADIVKNDGTRIVALAGRTLQVLRSWPAEQLAVQGAIAIEGWPHELFLDGHDRAVVFSAVGQAVSRFGFGDVVCIREGCGTDWESRTKITEVDLSDPAHPRVARELFLPGHYITARLVDRSIRLVLSDSLRYPAEMPWFPAWDDKLWSDRERLRAAWDQLIIDNEKLIRAQPLSKWLRDATLGSGSSARTWPQACTEFSRVNAPTRMGTLTVATWNLAQGALSRRTVLADTGTVYASATRLYVATSHWWSWPAIGQSDQTYIHQFDIARPDRTDYLASGVVDGLVGNALAMDEAASGHLRVVSTLSRRVADPRDPSNTWGQIETAARLTVLEPQAASGAGVLAEVGRTADLAPGERVMSARLMGNRGFVVTFRQVDPLFAIDLSDPRAPKVAGELKIPGFSTYLHPLDEQHLLGIGTYVPEPVEGQPVDPAARGLQLSVFDVSDLARPRQTHTRRVGSTFGASEAQWDPRAFTFVPSRGLLALPYTAWEGSIGEGGAADFKLRSEVQLYRVTPQAGIEPRGALSLDDMGTAHGGPDWTWWQHAWPRRSIIADDWLYAVSDLGVRVAPVDRLAQPAATATFIDLVAP